MSLNPRDIVVVDGVRTAMAKAKTAPSATCVPKTSPLP